ncbi:MAG: hypothetical protein ACW987_15110 [Candidatus Thorarchaeota archaeon]|jgi:hypothetical protein
MSKARFTIPLLFSAGGVAFALFIMYQVTQILPSFGFFPFIAGSLFTDISIILGIAIPVIALLYFIIGFPLAALFLLGSRMMKSTTYNFSIMDIGDDFGGYRMIRRSVAPALFSISSAGFFIGLVEGFILDAYPPALPDGEKLIIALIATLMGALIIMPIALALFIPTWILNDAGIVTHLKEGQLNVRQCPDTEGVGRWYSSMLGGYSILSFPIAMASAHFIIPYVINGIQPTINSLIVSSVWTLGIPLLMMAFIIPVVLLNEAAQKRAVGFIQRFARGLAAGEVEIPIIARKGAAKKSAEEPPEETKEEPPEDPAGEPLDY